MRDRDLLGLRLAYVWADMGTCRRRKVGCVLMDEKGHQLSTGYNGPASGLPHCVDLPCPGAAYGSGEGLEKCEAIHAEQNALIRCSDPTRIYTCYVTHSPCLHCVKMLMNTACKRIVFSVPYAHDQPARELWERQPGRTWITYGAIPL